MKNLDISNCAEYRTSEFANQFCEGTRIPIVLIGYYCGTRERFNEITFGGDYAAIEKRRAELTRATEVRLATFCSLRAGDSPDRILDAGPEGSDSILALMKEQDYLIGVSNPIDGLYPVISFEAGSVVDRRAWRALVQIGTGHMAQQLTQDMHERSYLPDCLLETAFEMLSVEFLVVDTEGKIVFDGLKNGLSTAGSTEWMVCNGRLKLRIKKAQADFEKAIRLATSGKRKRSMFSIFSSTGAAKLVAVAPLAVADPPQAVVLFERKDVDHTNQREQFFDAYGLTRSERLIAAEILGGRSIAETAKETHLSLATVRSYVKTVLSKTSTHRQSEFISLYFTSIIPITSAIEAKV